MFDAVRAFAHNMFLYTHCKPLRALYQKELLDQSAGYNVAFPYLVVNILPSPLLGLMVLKTC